MKLILVLSCMTAVLACGVRVADAAPQVVPFDRAYTVSAPGSTTPVSEFDINGPAPWLYLDLPSPRGEYSYSSSTWFADSSATAQFSLSGGSTFSSEQEFWLSPSPAEWELKKSIGDWHINANYGWWTLVIIYGGGAPVTYATGSEVVTFTVSTWTPGPTVPINPEPASILLCGLGAAALFMTRSTRGRHRRK
ncbi:MAG: hypothetical protein QOF78_3805 [Phycisphaerales bacterium]|nr:hypothetical protein [Phycisphaerales bacterium]